MSPEDRRRDIVKRQHAGKFSNFQIIAESGYQGYNSYAYKGTDASDKHVYAVEQALDRLETKE